MPEGSFCERCGSPLPKQCAPADVAGIPERAAQVYPPRDAYESAPTVQAQRAPIFTPPSSAAPFRPQSPSAPVQPQSYAASFPGQQYASPYQPEPPAMARQQAYAPYEPMTPAPSAFDDSQPALEVDMLCVLFEKLPGLMRFNFNPRNSRDGLQNIRFLFENQLTGERVVTRPIRHLNRPVQIPVSFPAQEAGALAWNVTVEYECRARRRVLEGAVQMVVVHPKEPQRAAENLAINITNTINNGNASDVHVSQRALEDLVKLSQSENPSDELRRIVSGGARAWSTVELFDADELELFPPMPPEARTDRVTLDLGVHRVTFFAGRTVTFGRMHEINDIVLRPPSDASEDESIPYRKISRAHCHFEHRGETVVLCDGSRDQNRIVKPSMGGTYWNDRCISGFVKLSQGESGVVSFAGPCSTGAISMNVTACAPSSDCRNCPYVNKTWCGDGARPSLMLKRRDGFPEMFVAVWSCFSLENADPSLKGVVIFRKDGGFAWRKGRRCGWIVPGTKQHTDFGVVTVS